MVVEILRAVVDAVDVPVTLKIRTGTDLRNRNGVTVAKMAESCGISAIAVHGRTRACKFHGAVEYDTIGRIKESVSIPVIANGDVDSPREALYVLTKTGADAVMVGRAAQGRPWLFKQIQEILESGTLVQPTFEQQRDTLLQHLKNLYEFYDQYVGMRVARKHISWYAKARRNGEQLWNTIKRLEGADQQYAMVEKYFNGDTKKDMCAA